MGVGFIFVLSLVYWQFMLHRAPRFQITFLDIGQGDSALIQFRNGKKMLIDCGPDKKVLSQIGAVLPWYDRQIDYLLVTHPDADHYAGCIDVLKRYDVTHIFTNGRTKDDALYRTFAAAIAAEPNSIAAIEVAPDNIEIAGTMLEFLAPDPTLGLVIKEADSNNTSIVFRLVDGLTQESVLFTGDMEQPLENALLNRYCKKFGVASVVSTAAFLEPCPALQAKILKVGHHGSESSSGKEFLAAVAPKTAVISVGTRNKFGHPSLRVLKRLEREGVLILRTDQRGAIVVAP